MLELKKDDVFSFLGTAYLGCKQSPVTAEINPYIVNLLAILFCLIGAIHYIWYKKYTYIITHGNSIISFTINRHGEVGNLAIRKHNDRINIRICRSIFAIVKRDGKFCRVVAGHKLHLILMRFGAKEVGDEMKLSIPLLHR